MTNAGSEGVSRCIVSVTNRVASQPDTLLLGIADLTQTIRECSDRVKADHTNRSLTSGIIGDRQGEEDATKEDEQTNQDSTSLLGRERRNRHREADERDEGKHPEDQKIDEL